MIASRIHSQSAIAARSVSKPPVVIRPTFSATKNGSGLSFARPFEPLAGDVGGEIQQEHRYARVGEMRGNLRAHRAGTENSCSSHQTAYSVQEEIDDRVRVVDQRDSGGRSASSWS